MSPPTKNAVREALVGKLEADTAVTEALGDGSDGVYHGPAPSTATYPLVEVHKQAGNPRYALQGRAYQRDVWLIKAIDVNPDATLVDQIASRIDAVLTGGNLTIADGSLLDMRRESDVEYTEPPEDGQIIRHSGGLYALSVR